MIAQRPSPFSEPPAWRRGRILKTGPTASVAAHDASWKMIPSVTLSPDSTVATPWRMLER